MADEDLDNQLEDLFSSQEDPIRAIFSSQEDAIRAIKPSEPTTAVEKKRQQDQLRSKAQLREEKQLTICFLT